MSGAGREGREKEEDEHAAAVARRVPHPIFKIVLSGTTDWSCCG